MVEILLVEDNAGDAELAIRALKKHNLAHGLVHVKDGREALDFIFKEGDFKNEQASNVPKVILLDLKLPRIDGIEVLRHLKAHPVARTIPVVILSSSKELRDVRECYELGVNSYVVKPMEFDGFAGVVSELGHYWLLTNQRYS